MRPLESGVPLPTSDPPLWLLTTLRSHSQIVFLLLILLFLFLFLDLFV
jgi:hypothetical protein